MSVALVGVVVGSLEGVSLDGVSLEDLSTADVVVLVKGHGGEAAKIEGRRTLRSVEVRVKRIIVISSAVGEIVGCLDVSD